MPELTDQQRDRLRHSYYCTECQDIIGPDPVDHRAVAHDDDPTVAINRIQHSAGESYIAQDSSSGHLTPHQWRDVEGQETCQKCGAVRITTGMIEAFLTELDLDEEIHA